MANTIVLTEKERILLLEQEVENLRERVSKTEDQLGIYQASTVALNHKITEIAQNINSLTNAIIGDNFGNPGFVKRMEGLEKFHTWFEKRKWWTLGAFAVITTAIGAIAFLIEKISSYVK